MAAPSSTVTQDNERTPGQVRQLEDIARHAMAKAIERLNPGKSGSQQAIDRAGEIAQAIEERLEELCEEQFNYPQNFMVKPLADQVRRLHELFPSIGGTNPDYQAKIESGEIPLPEGAEGWFAIPNLPAIHPSYSMAASHMLAVLGNTRKLTNYLEGRVNSDRFRRTKRTEEMLAKLSELQGNPEILIMPGQFGKRHAGRSSVRCARYVIGGTQNEFGLGVYEVAVMLLTHPERLVHYDNLWIHCPADDYDHGGIWGRVSPSFHFVGDQVLCNAFTLGIRHRGSASAFVPQ